jgi:hypothetical protein
LRFRFQNPALYRIGLTLGYSMADNQSLGLDFTWNDYDYGRASTSVMNGGSFSFGPNGTGVYIFMPSLGLTYRKAFVLTKKTCLTLGDGVGLGKYLKDSYNSDTTYFNQWERNYYDSKEHVVIVEDIVKAKGLIPWLRFEAGCRLYLRRRFYFNPPIIYQ